MFVQIGIEVIDADEDADIVIVNTAVNKSPEYEAVKIVGEDTDLLILLKQYSAEDFNICLEKQNKKKDP